MQATGDGVSARGPQPVSTVSPCAAQQQIVVFDFDGTLIDTSSPVKLITRLNRDKIMSKRAVLKSLAWGIRYKMGRELDQTVPRRYVFASFKDFPASEADSIMRDVYRTELRQHLRPKAVAALKRHQAEGKVVIIVSASFEPIISELCLDLGVEHYLCTQMEVVDGSYTGETKSPPPESEHKLYQFVAWADASYGPDGWELTHAYGDHYSDVPLMEIAQHPIAVDPDHRLRSIAHERHWEVHDWLS
ncbi:MAG: HAD-IB family hydrolase [Coriobacteriales bacterium]|nr:HAD-IB family hydrolase [Coriobacteriales bacterium]